MQSKDFGIDKAFTEIQRYKKVAEKAKRRNVIYDNYL